MNDEIKKYFDKKFEEVSNKLSKINENVLEKKSKIDTEIPKGNTETDFLS